MDDVRQKILSTYDAQAPKLSAQYQSVNSVDVLAGLNSRLPRYRALDIACGNGRDAKWLAGQGFIVDAVDGAAGMIREAQAMNAHENVTYGVDLMPALSGIREKVRITGQKYDVLVMSAAWMHLDTPARAKMFRTLSDLANPGAMMFLTLRHGPAPADRPMFSVTADEIRDMSESALLHFEHIIDAKKDKLGRGDVWWDSVCLRTPDRHVETLPFFRDGIINSAKNTSYKLGFTHCFLDLIRANPGMVREFDDASYAIPVGLMLPKWIRLYDGLAEAGLVQIRNNSRISDALNATRRFADAAGTVRAVDFTAGRVFEGPAARTAIAMMNKAGAALMQPTQFITRANSQNPVFRHVPAKIPEQDNRLVLDETLAERFGQIIVARDVVHAGQDYAFLIDMGIIREWARFTKQATIQNRVDEFADIKSRLEIALKAA